MRQVQTQPTRICGARRGQVVRQSAGIEVGIEQARLGGAELIELGMHDAWTAALASIGIAPAFGAPDRAAHPLLDPHRVPVNINPAFDDPAVVGASPPRGPRLLGQLVELAGLLEDGLFEAADPPYQPQDQPGDRVRSGVAAVGDLLDEMGEGGIGGGG